MIVKDAFLDDWRCRFGDIPPISYILKWKLPERWVRIHSLPQSKRYAQTTEEWNILIERHFALLEAVIHTSINYSVVVNSFDSRKKKPALGKMVPLGSFSVDNEDSSDYPIDAFLCQPPKSDTEMTKIFKRAADDELRFFFVQGDKIFAPYDGGIDIIADTPTAANALKSQFRDWLSKEPSGL